MDINIINNFYYLKPIPLKFIQTNIHAIIYNIRKSKLSIFQEWSVGFKKPCFFLMLYKLRRSISSDFFYLIYIVLLLKDLWGRIIRGTIGNNTVGFTPNWLTNRLSSSSFDVFCLAPLLWLLSLLMVE